MQKSIWETFHMLGICLLNVGYKYTRTEHGYISHWCCHERSPSLPAKLFYLGKCNIYQVVGVDQNVAHEDIIINIHQLPRMYIEGRRCHDTEVFLPPLSWEPWNPLRDLHSVRAVQSMHTLYGGGGQILFTSSLSQGWNLEWKYLLAQQTRRL